MKTLAAADRKAMSVPPVSILIRTTITDIATICNRIHIRQAAVGITGAEKFNNTEKVEVICIVEKNSDAKISDFCKLYS